MGEDSLVKAFRFFVLLNNNKLQRILELVICNLKIGILKCACTYLKYIRSCIYVCLASMLYTHEVICCNHWVSVGSRSPSTPKLRSASVILWSWQPTNSCYSRNWSDICHLLIKVINDVKYRCNMCQYCIGNKNLLPHNWRKALLFIWLWTL